MQESIVKRLKAVTLGTPQALRNVVVFPITNGSAEGGVHYITLAEALESHVLTVSEVSQGGSVPELSVNNTGEVAVLLLDGEELAGAKQNRVLNTTVLVPAKQSILIPVSCTEQGRWGYATPTFHDSGHVMSRSIRARKNQSVSASLDAEAGFHSNQGEVWEGISQLQEAAGAPSPTSAMRDVFESRRESLDDALKSFPAVEGQIGLLALINGEAVGFDIISLPAPYARLHGKLVKSYVMDALVGKKKVKVDEKLATTAAQGLLNQAMGCEEKTFKSVGHGNDYRFKGSGIAGSALIHNETVIHAAFFHVDQATPDGRISDLSRRRSYRVN
jgi:hypothetical protein